MYIELENKKVCWGREVNKVRLYSRQEVAFRTSHTVTFKLYYISISFAGSKSPYFTLWLTSASLNRWREDPNDHFKPHLRRKPFSSCLAVTFALWALGSAESCWASWGQCKQGCLKWKWPLLAGERAHQFSPIDISHHAHTPYISIHNLSGGGHQGEQESENATEDRPGHLNPCRCRPYSGTDVIFWIKFLV